MTDEATRWFFRFAFLALTGGNLAAIALHWRTSRNAARAAGRLLFIIFRKVEEIMTAVDDLKQAVSDLEAKETDTSTALSAVQQAITDEIARVEEVISSLPDNPGIAEQVVKLQTLSSNLQSINDGLGSAKGALDAERPAPAPPPAG